MTNSRQLNRRAQTKTGVCKAKRNNYKGSMRKKQEKYVPMRDLEKDHSLWERYIEMMMKCIIFCVRANGWAGSITNKDPPLKDNVEDDL